MIRLTYASTAITDFNPENLLTLLKTCRVNNAAKNITGILLYSHGTFFQVLEGDEAAVAATFEIIKKDKRHKDITLIEKLPITERTFPYWSMGFEKLEAKELSGMEGFNDFFENDLTPAGFASHKHIIGPLLAHLHSKLVKQITLESAEQLPAQHEELPKQHEDPFIQLLHRIIRLGLKFLALLMVIVILFGIMDVVYVIFEKITRPPFILLTTNDMLETFGAFLAVLIAIEIFLNITVYIRSDVIPVNLVVATALMAICRKIIVFDYKHLSAEYVSASALVVIALGITYWLVQKKE
ncbi:MAG: phosphate-starvation-inducible PsiE family protein [Methylobacter sp.]|nr:phosphate-starvation-inducible PsiE family protein [Methylobacter sp.]